MPEKTTITGLPENTEAALTYLLWWVSGLLFLILEKDSLKVRFHALQSIVIFGLVTVIPMIPILGWVLAPFVWLGGFVLWLVLIVKTYQGEDLELPVVSEFVRKQVK